jgi:hypothetical protein
MTGSLSNSSSSLLELTDEQDDSESSTDNTVASGEQGDIQLTCTTLQQFMAVEVCHRSIESWLVVILSIVTPNFSILLYVKSLQWLHDFDWDESIMSFIYFTQTMCFGVGSVLWVFVMQRVALSRCLSAAGLLYTMQCLGFLLQVDQRSEAVMLSALTGFASSASGVLFMACMFFEDMESSISLTIKKFGWVEGLRTALSGLILGALVKSPHNATSSSTMVLCIYSPILIATFGISLALLFGSQSKMKTTKMPTIRLSTFLQLKSYPLLAASQLAEAFIGYNAVFIVTQYSAISSGVLLFVFSRVIAPLPSTPKCFTTMTTALVNPTILMILLMMASPTLTAPSLLIFMSATLFLMKLKQGLIGIWMLQVNSSRWRIVTYHGVELFITNLVSATSPFIMQSVAKVMSFSTDMYDYSNATSTAQAILLISLPFILVSFGLQVLANKHYYADACDIYTKSELMKTKRNLPSQERESSFCAKAEVDSTSTNLLTSTILTPLLNSEEIITHVHEEDSLYSV